MHIQTAHLLQNHKLVFYQTVPIMIIYCVI